MKNWKSVIATAIIAANISVCACGQNILWVKQVLTANSGKFEYPPPYQDFVSLQAFDVLSQSVNEFSTIYTQSSQDILIMNNMAYFACQDSIVKYKLSDYSRLAAIAD